MPAWTRRLVPLCRRQGWTELMEDIASDKLSKNGEVSCETHLIFVAGLPKSGTTWLEQLLDNTLGMVQLNKSSLRAYPNSIQLPHLHDVDERMLTCAPRNRLSFLKLHLNPYPRNFSILDDLNVKTVILIRDLRDMLISRYHHVISQKSHWDHQRLMGLPEASRLLESMKGVGPEDAINVIDYYESWVSGWVDRIKADQKHSIPIKYEEMSENIFCALRKIYDFYGYEITDDGIEEVITKHKVKQESDRKRDLKTNLKQRGRAASTLRKGITGEWRELFDEPLKDFIKEHAGQALIKTGYEKDLGW